MGEDIVTMYNARLADLKINSKPLINLLTMMAEDYIRHAPTITQVVEKHLSSAKPEIKLPVLYLIDSIIKNVKKDYVHLFTQNIVSTFCGVFEKVDDKTRGLLWKLRGTWNDHFPQKKLYAIDLRCHEVDPKWPMMSPPPVSGSIHVNPKFLNRNKGAAALLTTEQILQTTIRNVPSTSTEPPLDSSEAKMRAQLLAKQKELLELQTRKVELELMQTQMQIDEKNLRQKEEVAAKQKTVKQERLLMDMAETAKNRTEQCKQQLHSSLKPPSKPSSSSGASTLSTTSVKTVKSGSSSKSYDSDTSHSTTSPSKLATVSTTSTNVKAVKSGSSSKLHDSESHSSTPTKIAKASSETSVSSVDNSPSKKSKPRDKDKDKSDRDRRSRGKNEKSEKSKDKDRHESKEKESRHSRHRDKKRHGESSKDKEKIRNREAESDGGGPEAPPVKKSRTGKDTPHGNFNDLFGHQDVDLRAGSSCWTQVKVKSENVGDRNAMLNARKPEEDRLREDSSSKILRSPGPAAPTNSLPPIPPVACDPLGRPLVYNRLPNDPEERKRSLDSRSTSIDALEQFRAQHIDRVLQGTAVLTESDAKAICAKAQEDLDQGILTKEQCLTVIKQVIQMKEASAMREVQQMQMRGDPSWQMSNNTPNPWVTEENENNVWTNFGSAGFPRSSTPWETGSTPWMTSTLTPAPAGPNPFEEAIARPMSTNNMVDDLVPKPKQKDLHMAEQDVGHAIPIDKIMRQIRFYRDTAVVLMGMMNDEPRELSFQRDDVPRTVLINGKPLEIYLGEVKKFDLNRKPHSLQLGVPGRELYIDEKRYELFFGGRPKQIYLDGRPHTFQLLPPYPQVSVGELPRYDLVAGRVNLSIDAASNVPVFLDEKLQKIDVFGEPLLLRFCNGFQAVTLNGRPFPSNFGARLPFTITMPGSGKHYLRFSAISPDTERAIQAFVSANYGVDWSDGRNPFGGHGARGSVAVRGGNLVGRGRASGRSRRDLPTENRISGPNPWIADAQPNIPATSSSHFNSLDLLNNLFQTQSESNVKTTNLDHSYESEPPAQDGGASEETQKPAEPTSSGSNLNVSDLVANLIKFGLLPAATAPAEEVEEPAQDIKKEEQPEPQVAPESSKKESKKEDVEPEPKESEKITEPKNIIPPLPTVDVSLDDSLKERREIAIGQLFTGVQCSQCGLRFPPDQTVRYSQHLDWHFRQNRREKANARKALSRKWYYDLSDWIQFEEIEDLEERAASLFETQDADNDHDAQSPGGALNPEDFTVMASSHEGAVCPQCGEGFVSYFDEELEEWRLKNAKLDDYEGEQKLYHPVCHEDYLKSLVEESIVDENETLEVGAENTDKENEEKVNVPKAEEKEDDDEVLIIKEGKKEVVVMEIDIDDDDVGKQKNNSVTLSEEDGSKIVNGETKKTDNNVIEKETINNVEHDKKDCNDDRTALDSSNVPSPIIIDEDSTFLPGLTDETEGGVFGFALGSGSDSQPDRSTQESVEKKIIYEPMKFDMPPIKLEPPDEELSSDNAPLNPDEFLSTFTPFLPVGSGNPDEAEPMNIDLTEEDSVDAVESCARPAVTQIRTSIDGNLQHEEAATLPFIPAPKIRINISGMDTTPSDSPKEKVPSPQPGRSGESETGIESQEQGLVKDDGNDNSSNNTEMNKDTPNELVMSEELRRLKPRLVGRKLTNCPPKMKGEELSGLCVIC